MKAIQKVLVGMALLIAAPTFGEGIIWHGKWKLTSITRSISIPMLIGTVSSDPNIPSVVDQVRTVCTFNFCKNEVKGDETYTYTYNMRP